MDYFSSCFSSCFPRATNISARTPLMSQQAPQNFYTDAPTAELKPTLSPEAQISLERISSIVPAIREFYDIQDPRDYVDSAWPNNTGQTLHDYFGLTRSSECINKEIIMCIVAVLNPVWPEETQNALFSTTGYKPKEMSYAFQLKKSDNGMAIFEVGFSSAGHKIVKEKLIAYIPELTFGDFDLQRKID